MSHRLGGLIKGFRTFTDEWITMKASSSSASAPTSPTNFHYNDAKGVWNTRSTVQFSRSTSLPSITVVGQTSFASNGNATSTGAMSTPSGSASGDMLVLVVQTGNPVPTTPSGWTLSYSATSGAGQGLFIYTLNLVSAPASSYIVNTPSTTIINVSFFTLRKASGSLTFGPTASTVDSSLTSVVFPTLNTTLPSIIIAVSSVRAATTSTIVVPELGNPFTAITNIANGTSTTAARTLITEYGLFDSGSTTPATKTLPATVTSVIAATFAIS